MKLKGLKYKLVVAICVAAIFMLYNPLLAQVRIEPKPQVKRTVEEEKAREQTRWMYKNLSLEPEQYEKVSNINLTYAYKCDSIERIGNKALKNEYKSQIKKDKDEQIKLALTEQQYKQYISHKEKQSSQKKSPFTGTYLGN